jgi:hypothetical protein
VVLGGVEQRNRKLLINNDCAATKIAAGAEAETVRGGAA